MKLPRPYKAIALFVVVALVLASGCGGSNDGGSSGRGGDDTDAASQDPWSEEAQKYGLGPQPTDDVTFQDDVVIVSGAGKSVRSVTDGGLTWHLDPDADGARDLKPGVVMFVTGRGVGRVLAVNDDGDDLAVTIGPVELTEVIRDGTFVNPDIDLDRAIEFPAIEPNWETAGEDEEQGEASGLPVAQPASFGATAVPTARAAAGTAFATCCATGIGAHFSYDQSGTRLTGNFELTFRRPKAGFRLVITGGSIKVAELEVSGGFGARVDFKGGIDRGARDIKVPFPLGGEWGFPIGNVLGVPLMFTMSQSLTVTTAFGANVGTIEGKGSFEFAGRLAYGYENGRFGDHSTRSFRSTSSILNSLTGVPVGVMGILIEHRVRFNVGFSAYVIKAGVFVDVSVSVGATRGSVLGSMGTLTTDFVECRGVGVGIWMKFGIGYSILEPVVNAINKFLTLINVKPIKSEAGPMSRPIALYQNEQVVPEVQLCGHTPGNAGRRS